MYTCRSQDYCNNNLAADTHAPVLQLFPSWNKAGWPPGCLWTTSASHSISCKWRIVAWIFFFFLKYISLSFSFLCRMSPSHPPAVPASCARSSADTGPGFRTSRTPGRGSRWRALGNRMWWSWYCGKEKQRLRNYGTIDGRGICDAGAAADR